MSDSLRSHSVLSLRDLEPSEFSTILPSPLSHVIVNVDGGVLKGLSVIFIKRHSPGSSILLKNWQLKLRISCCDTVQHVAKFDSVAILNGTCEDICNVIHEVSFINVFHSKD